MSTMKNFAMPRKNVIWIIVGLVAMIIGFILMAGGGSKNPDVFSPAIFSFRRLVIAPVFILAGIVIDIVAIMHKGKESAENTD